MKPGPRISMALAAEAHALRPVRPAVPQAAPAPEQPVPVNRDIPLSTRWCNGTRPLLRGWLVLSGGMVPGPAEDMPGWTLPWPCRLADLEAKLSDVRACEKAARQEWLDQGEAAAGVPAALALERRARVAAWLLDRESAHALGWSVGAGGTGDAIGDPGLQLLIDAMVQVVPGAVFRLEGAQEHLDQTARCIVADFLALEQTGRTHGRCLARMRRNVLSKLALPLSETSESRSGVTL